MGAAQPPLPLQANLHADSVPRRCTGFADGQPIRPAKVGPACPSTRQRGLRPDILGRNLYPRLLPDARRRAAGASGPVGHGQQPHGRPSGRRDLKNNPFLSSQNMANAHHNPSCGIRISTDAADSSTPHDGSTPESTMVPPRWSRAADPATPAKEARMRAQSPTYPQLVTGQLDITTNRMTTPRTISRRTRSAGAYLPRFHHRRRHHR